jgi:hypothetical protein
MHYQAKQTNTHCCMITPDDQRLVATVCKKLEYRRKWVKKMVKRSVVRSIEIGGRNRPKRFLPVQRRSVSIRYRSNDRSATNIYGFSYNIRKNQRKSVTALVRCPYAVQRLVGKIMEFQLFASFQRARFWLQM